MNKHFGLLSRFLLYAMWMGSIGTDQKVNASSFGLGLNYNSGGGFYGGAPIGYGAGYGSMGAINQCVNGFGGYGGGMGGGFGAPFLPVVVPPRPIMPPPMPSYGYPGFGGGGFPGMAGGGCGLCGGGVMAPRPMPMPMYAPGGPAVGNFYDGGYGRGLASNVIDTSGSFEWDKNDTAGIIMATGIGMGMQATNVIPMFGCPRNAPTVMPSFYNSGSRDYGLQPRTSH